MSCGQYTNAFELGTHSNRNPPFGNLSSVSKVSTSVCFDSASKQNIAECQKGYMTASNRKNWKKAVIGAVICVIIIIIVMIETVVLPFCFRKKSTVAPWQFVSRPLHRMQRPNQQPKKTNGAPVTPKTTPATMLKATSRKNGQFLLKTSHQAPTPGLDNL
uniref:Uncharacterized protein n=1 Tax=Panagrellus redivivus TaxID=6233 RepID=A0A7E4ZXI8_PANRE